MTDREVLERRITVLEEMIDEKCECYWTNDPEAICICGQQSDWIIERDAIRNVLAELAECERDHPPEPWASERKAENERLKAELAETKAYWEECQTEHHKRNLECQNLRDRCGRNAKLLKLCLYGEATDEMIEMALAEAHENGMGA